MEEFDAGTIQYLHLARGLLCHGILHHAMCRKRWLVEYGIDNTRCLMAVPFLAKGVPSPSAEFGHPDVAICLTCLSYYYTGLSEPQLRKTFQVLFKSADPSLDYSRRTRRLPGLGRDLQHLDNVNLQDGEQFHKVLFPSLRYNKHVIDLYLSGVVFPSEAKECPKKLTTSAWDIPSEQDMPLTTGFSGTNDNRYLLPRSIRQYDLEESHSTNAMVLIHLLREENRSVICPRDEQGQAVSVPDFLTVITQQSPRNQSFDRCWCSSTGNGQSGCRARMAQTRPQSRSGRLLRPRR